MPSFVFHFHKKWKTKNSSFFVFHFHEEIEKKNDFKIKINFMVIFASMDVHVIYEQVRLKSPEIFRCAMVKRTSRIRCLENSLCILMFILLAATFAFVLFLQKIVV